MSKNPVLTALETQAQKESIALQITERGYAFIFSNMTTDTPAFLYTIGLQTKGRPEIFLSGNMEAATGMKLIEGVVAKWKKANAVLLGRMGRHLQVGKLQMPIELLEVDAKAAAHEYTTLIGQTFPDTDYRLVQLFWPDAAGKLPTSKTYTKDPGHRQHKLAVLK